MKSKINWKYFNILVLLLIIYMIYVLSPLWGSVFEKIIWAFLPIILAFSVAFVFNPIVSWLEKKAKVPRVVAILLIYALIIGIVLFIVFVLVKPYIDDLGSLSVGVVNLLEQIGILFKIDTTSVQAQALDMIEGLFDNITLFFTASGAAAEQVFNVVISGIVVVIVGIIFLINFDNIILRTKEYLLIRESDQLYRYVSTLYHDLTSYLVAEIIIAFIQFVEYAGLFLIIGIFIPEYLNYALVLGVCVAVFSLIPYFGGYLSSFFMILIALSLPNALYAAIPLGIFIMVFPNLDAYLINPQIYKKQLRLNPIFSITAMLLGQAFFGIVGIVMAIPFIIVLTITYNFYKVQIKEKVKQFKESL